MIFVKFKPQAITFTKSSKTFKYRTKSSKTKYTKLTVYHFKQASLSFFTLIAFHPDYRDFEQMVDPTYGNCYTYNSNLAKQKVAYKEGKAHGKICYIFL